MSRPGAARARPSFSGMRFIGRRDGAIATYAAVLDGAHLWLDLKEGAYPIAVRDVVTGAVIELGAAPHDLSHLTGETYEVLAGGAPVALNPPAGSPAASPLTRTPLAPDGVTRWEATGHSGRLRLVRHQDKPTAELDAVDVRSGRLHLRLRPPGPVAPGSHLLLLDTDDQVLATLPATASDGLVETLIGVDDLPAGYFGMLRLALGTDTSWIRIRRRANDLTDPNHAVLLPELTGDDDRLRARLRWSPDGLLALRSIDPDEEG